MLNNKLKIIIPARGGSKGIPRKNLALLNGIPLIAYPITEGLKSKFVNKVYVSTDDIEIKEVSEQYGAEVIDRPKQFAQDNSLDIDVMRHFVEVLDSYDDIIHLRATTPTIESKILDEAIKYFLDNSDCTSLRSAHESKESAYKFFKKDGNYWNGLFPEMGSEYYNRPRQELPKTYHPNGYIDIVRPDIFMNKDSLHGNKILSFITDFVHEVDTMNDLEILRVLYDKDKK